MQEGIDRENLHEVVKLWDSWGHINIYAAKCWEQERTGLVG
jgi:hypothetical protein